MVTKIIFQKFICMMKMTIKNVIVKNNHKKLSNNIFLVAIITLILMIIKQNMIKIKQLMIK